MKKILLFLLLFLSAFGCESDGLTFETGRKYYDNEKYNLAYKVWVSLAKEGELQSMHALAGLLIQGKGVDQDIDKGINYLTQSADLGNPYSAHLLAEFYSSGKYVDTNYKEAFMYASIAAKKGVKGSQILLSNMFRLGMFVQEDPGQAMFWLLVANDGVEPVGNKVYQELHKELSKPDFNKVLNDARKAVE